MQKVVVELLDFDLNDEDCKQRSIEIVSAQFSTEDDVTISTDAEENTLTVIGRIVVPQVIVEILRQYVCLAEVVSVETVEEAKPKKVQSADPIASAAAYRVSKLFDTIPHSTQTEPKLDSRFKTKQEDSPFIKPAGFGQYGKVDKQGGFAQNFNPPGLPAVDHKNGGFAQNVNQPGLPAGFVGKKHREFAQLAERRKLHKAPEFGQYGKVDKQGGFAQKFNPPGLPAVDHKNGGFAQNVKQLGLPAGFVDKKYRGFAQLPERHKLHKAPDFGQHGFVDEHKNPYAGFGWDASTSAATSRGSSTISGASTGSSIGAGTSRSSSTFSSSSTGTSRSSSTFSAANAGTIRSSSTFSAANTGTSRGSSTTSAASISTSRGTSRIPDNSRDTRTTTEISRQEKKKKEKK
ncbi:hypothetical protein MKX03_011214 [Papaver bracteatum]|nr:hypothetical protein MKX03_011214 [Papaver bracteatum]